MAKKIGLLLGSLNGAGAEKTVLTLAVELSKQGYRVDLVTLKAHSDYTVPQGVTHVVLQAQGFSDAQLKLRQWTETNNYDLFITSKAEFYDCICALKIVCSVHITPTAWIRAAKIQLLKRFLKRQELQKKFQGKTLVALSQGIKNDLISLGCHAHDITVIANSFDVDGIRKLAEDDVKKPRENYAIYVASFIKRKRHRDLLKAFKLLLDTNLDLVFLGKGPEEQRLKKIALKLGLQDRVFFYGWHENPYSLLKHAKISYLASEAEGLPRVLVESLIIGTPVVSTDCPSGPSEVMTGQLAHFLAPVGDYKKIASLTRNALKSYPISEFSADRFRVENIAKTYVDTFLKD